MSETSNKLRRKEVITTVDKKKTETSLPADSAYKQTVDQEEAEAVSRDGEKDMTHYIDFCQQLKGYILDLGSDVNMSPAKMLDIKKNVSLIVILLKKLNRLEKYRLKNARETLQAKKLKVDSYNLQLQNLRYEIYHLKKEVVKCLQFRSKDEDIDLVDEETFFKEAPETISRPDVTHTDPHQLKLARLEWELKQRKEQSDLCQKVEAENENVAADINKKRSQLDNLAPMLNQLLTAAKPLQENLGYPECPTRPQYKLAPLLPEPLYCLFVQTDAYRQACCSSIELKINGSEEEAEKINKMIADSQIVDSDSDTEEPLNKSSSSKYRRSKSRLSVDVDLKVVVDKTEDKRSKLCLAHPLTVDLTIFSSKKDSSSSNHKMVCTFSYLYNLHLVTVTVDGKSGTGPLSAIGGGASSAPNTTTSVNGGGPLAYLEILAGLFPNDFVKDGTTPNLVNHYQLKQCGLTFETSKLGYPYVWVQKMAGLDFIKSSSPASDGSCSGGVEDGRVGVDVSVSQTCVPLVVRKLKTRLKTKLELSTLLIQLENGQLTGPHHCNLLSWQSISWCQFKTSEITRHFVQTKLVNENWLFYKAILSRGTAKLEAYVAVSHDYPAVCPIFAVQIDVNKTLKRSDNDDSVRDIEKELNVHWAELLETWATHSLLRAQVEGVASCFDVYLECLGVKEFPRKKIFVKSERGRTRTHPYKCVSKSENLFAQR